MSEMGFKSTYGLLQTSLLLLLLVLTPNSAQNDADQCDFVILVKCFIDVLDNWAWTLYELRKNVVTITAEQCVHLRELEKCVNDDLGRQHGCEKSQVVEASRTVSDLLTHRKNSGTFLKSYYLLRFACSKRGQTILARDRECLDQEHIGQMTMAAVTYLTDKFMIKRKLDDRQVCKALTRKIQSYQTSMRKLCAGQASELMCESLLGVFTGIYPERLAECDFRCASAEEYGQLLPTEKAQEIVAVAEQAAQEENSARRTATNGLWMIGVVTVVGAFV